ncbi:MAG: hypothetical protein ACFFAN_13255 [Promethearchaeota archaeon]
MKEFRISDFVQECYENVVISIKYTLKRLKQNSKCLTTINKLRAEEWRDWQLLGAIKTITIVYRTRKLARSFSNKESLRSFLVQKSKEPEKPDDIIVPYSEFSECRLRNTLISNREILKKQYVFDNEDIDHQDPFQ